MRSPPPNLDLSKSFAGIRICDLSQGIAGPHATMLLAQYGADVIKVEPPAGDWGRLLGPAQGDHCVHSWYYNLGKRSISLDLKTKEGCEALTKIAQSSDVLIESFRPGVAARLGFGYDAVRALRPDVVYVSVSGFGQHGPYSERGTVDSLMQGFSGMMTMNQASDGTPHRQNMVAVDVLTGLYVFTAISSALFARRQHGQGGFLDISLMHAAANFQAVKIAEFHASGGEPQAFYGPVGYLPTADGGVSISCRKQNHYEALCQVLGRPDLCGSSKFASVNARISEHDELMRELGASTSSWQTNYLLTALQKVDVLAEKAQTYGQWLTDPHVTATNAFEWTEAGSWGELPLVRSICAHSAPPQRRIAPDIGEHSLEIRQELGLN